MDQNDWIAKVKAFFYALRHGQREKAVAILMLGLFAGGAYLVQAGKQFPEFTRFLSQAAYVAYGLGAVSALWLAYRLWKLATPPPPPPEGPVSSAIKGLLPFTEADGKLFAQLGRNLELQQLLALAQNDHVAISAVRGESGAGKTSLLQAGLAYRLGEERCVYWEAVPEKAPEALLHAIRSRIPGIESLESLPEACPQRCVLLLDQFEQLRAGDAAHAPVFALLDRIAQAPAPHKLSAMVGFRREYAADWLDLEKEHSFRAEQISINLLAPRTAGDALVTLAGEAGFTLDQALVENFIAGVAGDRGVSPVDLAIGVLSLANFVQQRGSEHVGIAEYRLAGGAEGLLLSFVQQKLEEVPETLRAPLLKGMVLALVDISSQQRIAGGATAAAIASKAEVAEGVLAPWLERLAHPRVRLLENMEAGLYRLPHERLVPVLRRLAGGTLAALDQLRLLFEGEYARWRESRNRRYLLRGSDLENIARRRSYFVQGEAAAGKAEYLVACLRRRAVARLLAGVAVVSVTVMGYAVFQAWDSSIQRQKLASWHLPPEIFKAQDSLDQMHLSNHPVNDLAWLRSARLKKLDLKFDGSNLAGLEPLQGLTSLSLNLRGSKVTSLAGLEPLQGLTSLSLVLSGSPITSLAGLEPLQGLTSLSLVPHLSKITSLAGLEQLKGLTSLSLNLYGSEVTSLAGLEPLQGLTSLSLDLSDSQITSLSGLEQLHGLTSLSLDLSNSQITSLAGLEQLHRLTSFSLNLFGAESTSLIGLERLHRLTSLSLNLFNSPITSLTGLEQLHGLTSLSLNLSGSRITSLAGLEQLKGLTSLSLALNLSKSTSLAGLEQLKGLTSLSLDLRDSNIASLAGLEQLKGLTSLSLNLGDSGITSLAGLEPLQGLTSLSLVLHGSTVVTILARQVTLNGTTSLAGLEQLKGLTSLSLNLGDSGITSLAGLEQLKGLTSMEITMPASLVSNFSQLKIRRDIVQLWIVLDANTPLDVPTGCKFVGFKDTTF